MADDAERKTNREKLGLWFLENPGASIDAALKAAIREKRALGLNMPLAAQVKREAERNRRLDAAEAERKRIALLNAPPVPRMKCDRCGSTEHYISACPVIPEAPPIPLPQFEVDGDRDDEGVWVAAGQFLFEKMAEGLVLATPQVYDVVSKLGPKRFWSDALQRLNGRVFEMTPQADGPGSANLWACRRDREHLLLEIAASPELTAGVLWNGTETARVNKLLEPTEEPAKEPEVAIIGEGVPTAKSIPVTPAAPAAAPTGGLLPTLLNIQKLCAASLQGQQLLKNEIDTLRTEVGDLKELSGKLDVLITMLGGQP